MIQEQTEMEREQWEREKEMAAARHNGDGN